MVSNKFAAAPMSVLYLVLAFGLVVFFPLRAAAQEEDLAPRYFVDVFVPELKDVQRLADEQFDIAGVDRSHRQITVGIVADDKDLGRLTELGFTYSIREYHASPRPLPQALSDYTDPAEMETFLNQVVADHPNLAQLIVLKDSLYEGSRKLYALKITANVSLPNDRPVFLLDAQHHAREVMCSEISRDMIDYLTNGYATDPQVQSWLDNINVYVVPQVNPDGINWVFTSYSMWRKNRHTCSGGTGIDINRNYSFAWNACGGSSGTCTDDTYRGTAGDSELETQGLQQIMGDTHAFFALSYHSYGQYIIYPFGCGSTPDEAVVAQTANALNAVLQGDNGLTNQFTVGTPPMTVGYGVDGGSSDNQYAKYGSYSYVIEVNGDFQPDYATWRNVTVQRQRTAWQFFLNKIQQAPQIRGKVTDASTGLPLAADVALQEVTYTHGELPRHADVRGIYHWLVNPGTYHLTFSMTGYCTRYETVTVGSGPVILDVQLGQPEAPAGLTATPNGDNRIDLSWGSSAGVDEYHVLRSITSGGPYTQIATVPAPGTSYSDTAATGNRPLYYVIRAFRACESGNSNEATAQTTGACLLAPNFAGLSAVANAQVATCTLNLTWSAASPYCSGPVTYNVYRSTLAGFTPGPSNRVAASIGANSYQDLDQLTGGTRYYYVVRAVDSSNGYEETNAVERSGVPTGPYGDGTFTAGAEGGDPAMTQGAPWATSTTYKRTGTSSYSTGASYPNNACGALTTPAIILGTSPVLSFYHIYSTESGYDGGRVEISENGTTWTALTPTPAYPGTITSSGNACAWPTTTPCYIATSTGYPTTWQLATVNLYPTYSNMSVYLRWNFATDTNTGGSGASPGWYVDDITVTNIKIPSSCATGSACGNNPSAVNVSPDGPLTICSSSAQLLTASPTGGTGLSYQWYVDGAPIGGATLNTYTANSTGTRSYNCQVTGSGCVSAMSDGASTQITWQAAPVFAGCSSVTNAGEATCKLNVAWSAASSVCVGPLTYKIYRSTTTPVSIVPGNLIASGITGTTYSDSVGLNSGTTYYYVVRAMDGLGQTDSNTVEKSGAPTGSGGGPFTLVNENFEGTWGPQGSVPPTGWTIEDHGSQSPPVWDNNDWYNYNKGGTYLHVARVYYSPVENQNDWLITPAFTLPSTATSATLEYDHYFYVYASNEFGYVDFMSDQTPSWTTLATYSATTGTSSVYAHASISLLPYLSQTNCKVRFRYVANNGWYWEVDNVKVSGVVNNPCSTGSSGPPRVPHSVSPTAITTANHGTDGTVTWDVSNCASTNYHCIYGKGENLAAWTVDGGKCSLGTSGAYNWTSMPDPSSYTSRFLWFLIVGNSGSTTEGSWGLTSGGAERGGSNYSNVCGMTTKNTTASCGTP